MWRTGAVVVAVGAWLLSSTSTFAGFVFDSGTLRASAHASDRSGSASFTATRVTIPNADGATISATVKSPDEFMYTTGGASTIFSMLEWTGHQPRFSPAIRIIGSTQAGKLDGSVGSPSSGGSAGGSVRFIETATETFNQSFLFGSNWNSANVTIKNSLNQTIASFFAQNGTTMTQSVTLTPGTYTLDWSHGSVFRVGTLGPSGMEFQLIPEPASLALFALPAMALVRGRRQYKKGWPACV